MADVITDLPCNTDGICMMCKREPLPEDLLPCNTCASPWHLPCLSVGPETSADAQLWDCPDCTNLTASIGAGGAGTSGDLVAAIRALEADESLNETEKAKKRQQLMSKSVLPPSDGDGENRVKKINGGGNDVLDILDKSLTCSFCHELPERPVTTPCGHNFCLKCYEKWVAQGKRTCANCRQSIPSTLRINSVLVAAIRIAKASKCSIAGEYRPQVVHHIRNQDRPDKAFTTERAKKPGNANAASGRIFVTTAQDHLGPVTAEYDPERNQGVEVGRTWVLRMDCRQWGIHFPMVSGIAGQSEYGAQSVVLSGGYIDDEDHGEWFIYTGSGGKDLSGNKRTNKQHSKDQEFTKLNQALKLSCVEGYPVRVVRSNKEKRSSYAPTEKGLRYDGVYRIEKCWRKIGTQGYKVCRYLFVRCDNEPAPWTSEDRGDRPRPLPVVIELKNAIDITERTGSPSWDYDAEKECWMWKKPPPFSRKLVDCGDLEDGTSKMRRVKQQEQNTKEKVLKKFKCEICQKIMSEPVTTPCAHSFCKPCLEGAFAGISLIKQRKGGGRTLRVQKNVMKCPTCPNDIADFLQNPKVNKELDNTIKLLQQKEEDAEEEEEAEEKNVEGEEDIHNASEETVDDDKDNISVPVPQTETTPQETCEQKKPTRKRNKSSNGENGGVMVKRSKGYKVA